MYDKSILKYITFKNDYPLASHIEESTSIALSAFVGKLKGYTKKRNDLKLILQMLALTSTNENLKNILKIMVHKKILMNKKWKIYITKAI